MQTVVHNNVKRAGKRTWFHYRMRKELWYLAFIAPQLPLFVLFTVYPIIMSYVYAFFSWNGYGPLQKFVGFYNYKETLLERPSMVFRRSIATLQNCTIGRRKQV